MNKGMTQMSEEEIASCCNDIYSNPLVTKLLDGMFHPGGLALSNYMAERMKVDHGFLGLDIACGDGATATFLARKYNCQVFGIDASSEMIEHAKKRAIALNLSERTEFKVALAGSIPYESEFFTGAYSECALCIFPNKNAAISEISRVLKNNAALGISDITLENPELLELPLRSLLGQVACVAGALSVEGFKQQFVDAGFTLVHHSSHSSALEKLATRSKNNAKMMLGLLESDEMQKEKLQMALNLIELLENHIHTENIGYDLFVFRK